MNRSSRLRPGPSNVSLAADQAIRRPAGHRQDPRSPDSGDSERGAPLDQPRARGGWLLRLLLPLAQPKVAGLVALAIYLARGFLSPAGLQVTNNAYFNYLADAFLHGQLAFRLPTTNRIDLVLYGGEVYLYSPPFPALLIMPLVELFGVGVSDVVYTAVFAAIGIALLSRLLAALTHTGIAPLSVERRAILVATCAFGSVLLILAPVGWVSFTAQIVGWDAVLLATVAALTLRGPRGYLLAGLALACAMATRYGLVFNGVWLAYYLFQRDRQLPLKQRVLAGALGLAPLAVAALLLGWYNAARFGSPLEAGLTWHNMNPLFRADFERYGVFSLHYLPINLYYQFVAYTVLTPRQWMGGSLFWMTPIFLGAPWAVWCGRQSRLVWALVLSIALGYIPIGLLMGTGYLTFGPRYLVDIMVPIVVLTARGIRRWRLDVLQIMMIISWATYAIGSLMWAWFVD